MEINRKRVAKRLASGLMAGALALGGLAISGAGSAGAVPIEEDSDQRIAGTDRYATSAEIAAAYEDECAAIETLVVASGENFPDALAAAGLTNANDADGDCADAGDTPSAILLVEGDSIPASVLAEMNRIDDSVETVYVVGGDAAVSDDVLSDIEDIFADADVSRIAGDNRYDTATRVADEIGYDGTVIIASGTSYADAITVGGWASSNATPILLANADGLPTETEDALADLIDGGDVDRVIIVGGTAVVGASVEDDLIDLGLPAAGVSRVAGANRYATNLNWNVENFSNDFLTNKQLDTAENSNLKGLTQLYVSGANFPDALAAAPLAAHLDAHLILTDPNGGGAAAITLAAVGKSAVKLDSAAVGTGVMSAITDIHALAGTAGLAAEADGRFGQDVWVIGGTSAVPSAVLTTVGAVAGQSLGCSVLLRKANDNDDKTGDGLGPDLITIAWDGPLQTGTDGELALLTDTDEANDLIDVEGTTITDGDVTEVDSDDDGFTDMLIYGLEDPLAEGDSVEFTGVEVDGSDYGAGANYGLRELTPCSASVERDNTEPTVTVTAVEGGADYYVEFSERMFEDYSSDIAGDIGGDCARVLSSPASYYCTAGADWADGDEIDFSDNTYYDYAGNELDFSDAVADFEVIPAEDYEVNIDSFSISCTALGSGNTQANYWEDTYSADSDDDMDNGGDASFTADDTPTIVIPFLGDDMVLLAGSGISGVSGNDWTFTFDSERGLLRPEVSVDGTDVTITIDGNYHDAADVARALRSSSVGGGGLSAFWMDNALASLSIVGDGLFDLDNLGEVYDTGSRSTAQNTELLANLVAGYTPIVGAVLDDAYAAGTLAGLGEDEQSCLWFASTDLPILNAGDTDSGLINAENDVDGEDADGDSAYEFLISFGRNDQVVASDAVSTDTMYIDYDGDDEFDGIQGGRNIYGVIENTTDALEDATLSLYVTSESNADAS